MHDAAGFLAERARAPPGALATRRSPTWSRIELAAPEAAAALRVPPSRLAGGSPSVLPADAELLGPAPRFRLRGRTAASSCSRRREREPAVVTAVRERRRRAGCRADAARSLAERRRRSRSNARPRTSRLVAMSDAADTATVREAEPVEPRGAARRASTGTRRARDPARERRSRAPAQIRKFGDPVLKSRASEITRFGPELEREAERMVAIMQDAHRRRAGRDPARRDAPAAGLPGRPRRRRRRRSPTRSSSGSPTRS